MLDKKEIDALLKYGAYDIFREDAPAGRFLYSPSPSFIFISFGHSAKQNKWHHLITLVGGTSYDEQDIDQILERSSRTVVHTATSNEEVKSLKLFS